MRGASGIEDPPLIRAHARRDAHGQCGEQCGRIRIGNAVGYSRGYAGAPCIDRRVRQCKPHVEGRRQDPPRQVHPVAQGHALDVDAGEIARLRRGRQPHQPAPALADAWRHGRLAPGQARTALASVAVARDRLHVGIETPFGAHTRRHAHHHPLEQQARIGACPARCATPAIRGWPATRARIPRQQQRQAPRPRRNTAGATTTRQPRWPSATHNRPVPGVRAAPSPASTPARSSNPPITGDCARCYSCPRCHADFFEGSRPAAKRCAPTGRCSHSNASSTTRGSGRCSGARSRRHWARASRSASCRCRYTFPWRRWWRSSAAFTFPPSCCRCSLVNPLTVVPVYFLAYKVGVLVTGAPERRFAFQMSWDWVQNGLGPMWKPFLIGCGFTGALLGLHRFRAARHHLALQRPQEIPRTRRGEHPAIKSFRLDFRRRARERGPYATPAGGRASPR